MSVCNDCFLPKDCEDCLMPSNVGLGQIMFSSNVIHHYNCDEWIIALLRDLDRKLKIVMWNINQEEYESPFDNTGNSFIGNNFEVHAYNWNEDINQRFNFKCGVIEISWYKYLGRGTTINGVYTPREIINMYKTCLNEIEELDGECFENC